MAESVPTGFLLVDKPSGWTSHDVVAKVRNLLRVKKVGHAGTLDPLATGLVVLGLRRATRLLRFVQAAPKEYIARAVFGVATDSLDADGAILAREAMDISEDDLRTAMTRFVGTIAQVPPMVSARKVGGKKLYELARQGLEVEREAREVEVHSLDLVEFAPSPYPEAVFRTVCSTGTYVRALADDVARALGGRAHLSALRRVRNGSLHVSQASSVAEIEQASGSGAVAGLVVPPRDCLAHIPEVEVGPEVSSGVRNGLVFPARALGSGLPGQGALRVVDEDGALIAVYRIESGKARPEVVLA
ncbi:MAG: tRNA pseudouridine(55) synthase TruB [Acidimicrobiia bacterium]|nr:tRNA pseudouridine(55) synthase TruB [Acidimicrobiia bacterium]